MEFEDRLQPATPAHQCPTSVIQVDDDGLRNIYDVPSDLPNSGAVVGVHMIGKAWIEVSDGLDELTTDEHGGA